MTGRYCYYPAAGKIRRDSVFRVFKRKKKTKNPDLFRIVDYYPPVYPSGYKK